MPRKIATSICELSDEFAAMGVHTCQMCGSVRGEEGETDRSEYSDLEIVRALAAFMDEDWKACCILLLYVASPNAPINKISPKIALGNASVCEARQRAAERFPALAGMLGLKTPRALAQQARSAKETDPQGDLFDEA